MQSRWKPTLTIIYDYNYVCAIKIIYDVACPVDGFTFYGFGRAFLNYWSVSRRYTIWNPRDEILNDLKVWWQKLLQCRMVYNNNNTRSFRNDITVIILWDPWLLLQDPWQYIRVIIMNNSFRFISLACVSSVLLCRLNFRKLS